MTGRCATDDTTVSCAKIATSDYRAMNHLIVSYLGHLKPTYSPHTIKDRYYLLTRLDEQLPYGVGQVATEDLEAWLAGLDIRPPSWTLSTYFNAIRSFYRWAHEAGRIDFDPAAALVRPRQPDPEPHPATDDQVALALTLPRPWSLAILLAAYAGLRCGEICRLQREDVTPEWIFVRGKGGRVRFVGTHDEVWSAVADAPAGWLVKHRCGAYAPMGLSTAISKRLDALGMEKVTLHWFRAWFATTQLHSGVDIRTVQELLGHKQVTTTQIYTAVTNRQRRNAVAALPVLHSPHQEAA